MKRRFYLNYSLSPLVYLPSLNISSVSQELNNLDNLSVTYIAKDIPIK